MGASRRCEGELNAFRVVSDQAVAYGGVLRTVPDDDRLIGSLWANLSEGRCRFVMVKDKRWEGIEEHLK